MDICVCVCGFGYTDTGDSTAAIPKHTKTEPGVSRGVLLADVAPFLFVFSESRGPSEII
jgi:hypothetical protein